MKKLNNLLQSHGYEEVAFIVSQMVVGQAVATLTAFSDDDLVQVCNRLDEYDLGAYLPLFDNAKQQIIIEGLLRKKLQKVIDVIPDDVLLGMVSLLPASASSRLADNDVIRTLIGQKKFKKLKEILAIKNSVDIAAVFEELDAEESVIMYRLLPKDLAADVFVELSADVQMELIEKLSDKEIQSVVNDLFIDDVVDIIEEMPASVVRRLLLQSDAETRKNINEILKYPSSSTGSIMTVELVSFSSDTTCADALNKIRISAFDKETIYTAYITDESRRLLGVVTMKELLVADGNATIGSIMHTNVIYAHTLDDREDTVRTMTEYKLLTIPVVDDEKRLVGIVTIDDAIDVLKDETTEDMSKIAAIRPSDKPYIKKGVFSICKNRLPWLMVLMISATFTGLIINKYEERLNAISTVLLACVPMLMDTGGNAGSQASVTIIRSLALNEIGTRDALKVLWKELRVSLVLGLCLAVACFAKLQLIDNLLFGYSGYTLQRSAIVAVSMFATIVIAKIIGGSLPILAKTMKLDPAVVASPFITTIVDALSLIIFCLLSVSILA